MMIIEIYINNPFHSHFECDSTSILFTGAIESHSIFLNDYF